MYPWLIPVWQQWLESVNHNRLSASTLFVSEKGLGIEQLLKSVVKGILCQNSSEGCGFCHSCQLLESESHPDFHSIRPEKEGKSITVEQIRHANRLAIESSQLGGYRVILIEPAEAMNESAANALLKTLEEPAEKCCFLLVTNQMSRILPTVLSRCRKVALSTPDVRETMSWLEQQGCEQVFPYVVKINHYAPLETYKFLQQNLASEFSETEAQFLSFLDKPVIQLTYLVQLLKSNPIRNLTWFWYSLTDALKIHQGIHMPDFIPESQEIARKVSYALLHRQLKALTVVIHQLSSQTGLNDELLITNWLLNFIEDSCL
ncbi:DNA polymerase III subunit delta' [Vibrio salinus]|uniref:DNA polymerase III subunit delta' n=1 Tax=Vibrio salinus TaxID=2899784 RepID=UPI001E46C72B|nr:DNA polymerase III subunit delta' [Vibrio salinus]MCE0494628.1 DNA polymerase III subunit delta' [Vibrio salinus]